MDGWIERIAGALGAEPLTSEEVDDLLVIAREVSRRTGDRRLAPLATFLTGVAVAAAMQRPDALRKSLGDLRAVLPERPPES
jgi:hypothetical protein